MATTKITDLTAYTDPVSTDVLPIVDVSGDLTKKVSIADLMENAGSGTEAAPGIAFDGDPNTGIYRPGADQLAISTGGTQRLLIDDSGVVTVAGDLTVNGTTTTVNSTTVTVDDKNIELGSVGTPTDTTADGGGITLKGATDKTINWVNSTDSWTSSENVDLASGKTYKINGTDVLSATALGSAVQISSDNIPSGTIVNDDVNASAAIAGTKVDPDFGSQTVETTGVFSAAGGAQATPSITFTGDLNTGIYSPGADQVAISTNGTGRLFVDANGRIGLGATPEALLHISSSAPIIRLSETDQAVDKKNWDIASFSGNLNFRALTDDGSAANRYLVVGRDATYGITALIFFTGSDQERLRITSDGKLGLGTSSPQERLTVGSGSGNHGITLFSGTTNTGHIYFADGTTGSGPTIGRIVYNHNDNSMQFWTANSQRLTVTEGGNVGIGTTSPDASFRVTIAGSRSAVGPGIFFSDTDASASNYALYINGSKNFVIRDQTAASDRFSVDSSGRILVGTSTSISQGAPVQIVANTTCQEWLSAWNGSGDGVYVFASRSRGTAAARTAVQNDDVIARYVFQGYSGAAGDFRKAAEISAWVDGEPDTSGDTTDMPGRLVFSTTANGAASPTERMRVASDGALYVQDVYDSTTATSANVSVNSNGRLRRSTSSAKYKTNIQTLEDSYADALLDCRPVWYQSTCANDNPDYGYWGFIAEEVAEIDPRLVFWKTVDISHDENGSQVETPCDPEPEGVAYDRFVPHLLNLIKRQQQAIETLEAKVAALEAG
jgi:hypothetical protein